MSRWDTPSVQPHQVNVDVTIHLSADVKQILTAILGKVSIMANELKRLEQEVKENGDVIDSAVTLIQGIKAALDAAIASGDPQKLTELSNTLDSKSNRLAQAVAENTPAEGGGTTDTGGSTKPGDTTGGMEETPTEPPEAA